ncbi:MAG: hydantoinase/oxoprolinase family protein [Hyphomicrobiales bacterium]|nr:hydantoinase/oxoprolinase family protein [Hyphomicrobiales bacterium]
MSGRIGIDVGGTFTDFYYVGEDGNSHIHKTLSTPQDPSIAVVEGLNEIAASLDPPLELEEFALSINKIVHGTTVTTNATLTRNGAKSGLITTSGLRDALEMRRGIREEQYNNHYTNVIPLVPRYLRIGVGGRLDRNGQEVEPLNLVEVGDAIDQFRRQDVEAVSICFMNSFANPDHERQAAELVRKHMPDAYLTVSSELLPTIRFYPRVSTVALNSYVGPILSRYIDRLQARLKDAGFGGVLLIMQSNGGIMAPQVARDNAALTLLSGPAAGPGAGLAYAKAHDQNRCIVIDMGGTSFEAALVDNSPVMVNEGEIDRHRLALPMLGIHTIGAGGGSIGRIDEGGLLRMGPESAGASPGPVSYGKGGQKPACTDADLVLGYLNPDYFAGGKMTLDKQAARHAIEEHIAKPLGMSIEEAAAGMYRVVCNNMAQGVREITIKRGFDPREFPMVVAGGAGPIHSCLIAAELEIPLQIVPRSSSILCAVGMLMSDLKHDFVRTFVSPMNAINWDRLTAMVMDMIDEGKALLTSELISDEKQQFFVKFDCRYLKQYHEVSFTVCDEDFRNQDVGAITKTFHGEHNRLYGYSLDDGKTIVEIINVRVQALGVSAKPVYQQTGSAGQNAAGALKGERSVYVPEDDGFSTVPVYDGHRIVHGNLIEGPAMIEEDTTAIFVSRDFACVCDKFNSFAIYKKGREDLVASTLAASKAVEQGK